MFSFLSRRGQQRQQENTSGQPQVDNSTAQYILCNNCSKNVFFNYYHFLPTLHEIHVVHDFLPK